MSTNILARTTTFGRMVKFSHSIFALPFAFVSGLVASQLESVVFTWVDAVLLVICMVSARTAAMGFNRVSDRHIDALNPRTSNRELPAGDVSLGEARLFTTIAGLVFIAASFALNQLCGLLSFPVLALLFGYSFTKRFTYLSHFVLGLCLGTAPIAVWFALTGSFSWTPIVLCAAITLWTAGFDIYYSCQDEEFDRKRGLRSIPARLGAMGAIRFVRPVHAASAILFALFGALAGMGIVFFAGAAAVAVILAYEAWILRRGDLSRINLAFFSLNGYVSMVFALTSALDVLLLRNI